MTLPRPVQPKAKADKIGVTGYCMGGTLAIRAAATFPDRIAAAAAFHAGHVVTEGPDSPHLQVKNITNRKYVYAWYDSGSSGYSPGDGRAFYASLGVKF